MSLPSFSVCVPVLNRYDLLREMLHSLENSSVIPEKVYIIDNGNNPVKLSEAIDGVNLQFRIKCPSPPWGVAHCWNWFIMKTERSGSDRIITNDDVKFSSNSIEILLSTPGDLVFAEGIGFSCFVIRDSCIDKIGSFDQSLSPGFAYFEDCDYINRINKYNESAEELDKVVMMDVPNTGIIHDKCATQRGITSKREVEEYRRKYWIAQENFIKKWGSLPGGLRYMEQWETGSVVMPKPKLKILWCGDAVASTGFAKCSHAVCDHLHETGWEVSILGLNYFGDKHSYPYDIYPCYQPLDSGHDYFGQTRLPRIIERLNPDVIVLLNDPWNIKGYIDRIDAYQAGRKKFNLTPLTIPPIIPWLAVDSCNQKGYELNHEYIKHVAVWTQFAKNELISGGHKGSCSVIPLGVDTSIFYPRDRSESRIKTCGGYVKDTDFIIGVVGRNQPRKRLDLTIYCFAEWVKRYNISDAWLYLHVAPTGDRGYDLLSLIKYFGVSGKVIINEPSIGYGDSESLMPYIYSAFDLYFSTSQAEGWGLCVDPSTLIQVPYGVKRMDSISVGESVMTHDGTFRTVRNKFSRKAATLRFRISGIPETKLTHEHPLLVLKGKSDPVGYYSRHDMVPEWMVAGKIKEGDFIACPRPKWDDPLPEYLDMADYLPDGFVFDDNYVWHPMGFSPDVAEKGYSIYSIQSKYGVSKGVAEDAIGFATGRLTPVYYRGSMAYDVFREIGKLEPAIPIKAKRIIRLDAEILSLIGWYLAEGSSGQNTRINIDLHKDEIHIARRLAKTIFDHFGLESLVEFNGENKCRVSVNSKLIASWLNVMCGKGARNKSLNSVLWKSAKHLGPLVASYFRGDGHYSKGKWMLTTASTNLAWQTRAILLSVGIHSSIRIDNRKIWTLTIAGDAAVRLSNWCGLKGKADRTRKAACTALVSNDYVFIPVKSIIESIEQTEVMDIEVDGVHSFIGNGIALHNCTLEAMACGVECLVPDQGALGYNGGWISNGSAATRIDCDNVAITAPLDNTPYTVGGIVDVEKSIQSLHNLYTNRRSNLDGINLAKSLSWRSTGEKFESMLKEIL